MRRKRKREPTPILEIGFSFISIGLALLMFDNPQMFDRIPDTYEFFRALAPEFVWGIILLAVALTKLIGLLTKRVLIRRIGLLGSSIIYGIIAAMFFLGVGWFNIGFITYGVLSFMALTAIREVQ